MPFGKKKTAEQKKQKQELKKVWKEIQPKVVEFGLKVYQIGSLKVIPLEVYKGDDEKDTTGNRLGKTIEDLPKLKSLSDTLSACHNYLEEWKNIQYC